MASQEVDTSTLVFYDPAWIQGFGGFLHSNNVLFYFAKSPFYDRRSANETVFAQAVGIPQREQMYLALRTKFEAELQHHVGIQYTVESDPLETKAKVRNPNGGEEPSDTWIIRKAHRDNLQQTKNELKILDYYYIINQTIFQAPRIDSILNYRMTNVTMTLDKMINDIAALPKFSASNGYSYYGENQKSTTTGAAAAGQQSKVGTPLPEDIASSSQEAGKSTEKSQQQSDDRTLMAALQLTLTYGEQYYDDAPLIGEPGNFRYGKTRDPVQNLKAAETGKVPLSKTGTPAPVQSLKQSPGPITVNSTALANNETDTQKPKPKRKKSLAANEAT